MRLSEYLANIKDFVTILGAFFAAYIAWQGLSTWRRQLRGNSQYELARRLVLSAYKVRDAVVEVRASGMHPAEMSMAMKELGWTTEGLDENKKHTAFSQAVYGVRWNKLQSALRELRFNALEAKVLWGDEPDGVYREIYSLTHKLWAAITLHFQFQDSADMQRDHQEMIKRMKIMHPSGEKPEDDEYMVSLDAAIAQFEKLARRHLSLDHG